MHIPDGFLDARTLIAAGAVSAGVLGLAVAKTRAVIGDKHIPLMGVMAAFIFAAQMVNFPVAGGTSGHFMGGALAAILLGPLTAVLVMTTVLIVQCLIFQDGGVTALGANIANMGVVGAVAGYYVFAAVRGLGGKRLIPAGAFAAGWLSIVLSSAACAVELSLSRTVPLKVVLPAMVGVHSFIGIGEGLITGAVLGFLARTRPDMLDLEKI